MTLMRMIRPFLLLSWQCYVGVKPPRVMHVTDDGVRVCTAIVQLMSPRCKRIILDVRGRRRR